MFVPYKHQLEAQSMMYKIEKDSKGGFLADSPGLGKTACMSMFLKENKIKGKADLIVCPYSIMRTWRETIITVKDWPVKGKTPSILMYHGSSRHKQLASHKFDYIITTYAIIGTGELRNRKWGRVVLDESHYIKNGLMKKAPKCAKEAFFLGRNSEKNWCLSATPFNNRMKDIAAQCVFVGTSPYNDPKWWKRYENNREKVDQWRDTYVIRRTKEGLLDKPIYHNITVEPTAVEQELVNTLRSKAAEKFLEWKYATGTSKSTLQLKLLGLIQRLRIVSNSFYCGEGAVDAENVLEDNAKVNAIANQVDTQLNEDPKGGIVIFSQFTSFINVLEQVLEITVPDVEITKFTGDMDDSQRDRVVKRFNRGKGKRIILVSLLAGGCGLSLHHGAASVFICEPYYNGFVEQQAEERVHRLGQKAQVNVFRYTMNNSVEIWMNALKEKKAEMAMSMELQSENYCGSGEMFSFQDLASLFMDCVSFTTEYTKKIPRKNSTKDSVPGERKKARVPRPKKGKLAK